MFTPKSNLFTPTREQFERLSPTLEQQRIFLPSVKKEVNGNQEKTIVDTTAVQSPTHTQLQVIPQDYIANAAVSYEQQPHNMPAHTPNANIPTGIPYHSQPQNIHMRPYPSSPLQAMEEYNKAIKIANKYDKNIQEQQLKDIIAQVQCALSAHPIFLMATTPPMSDAKVKAPVILANLSKQLTNSTNFDQIGILLQILGVTAIATHGRIIIDCGTWSESTALHIVHFAEAGTRKSSVISFLRSPFEEYARHFNTLLDEKTSEIKALQKVKKITNKALDKQLLEIINKNGINPDSLQKMKNMALEQGEKISSFDIPKHNKFEVIVDSVSPAGLRKILLTQGEACGVITAESDFLDKILLKTSGDSKFFNKLYTQEPYVVSSTREHQALNHPSLSMVNFVQLSIAYKLFSCDKLNNLGVTGRFLPFFSHVPPKHTCNAITEQQYTAEINKKIKKLLNLYYTQDGNAKRHTVLLERDAVSLIRQFENEVSSSIIPNMPNQAHPGLRKLHGQAVRIAWAIHAWNYDIPHQYPITTEEAAQAINICRYLLPHIRYAYDPRELQAHGNAIKIITNLQNINTSLGNKELLKGYITSRTIQQRTHIKAEQVNNALQLLERHGWLRIIDNGKQSNIAVLHPHFKAYHIN